MTQSRDKCDRPCCDDKVSWTDCVSIPLVIGLVLIAAVGAGMVVLSVIGAIAQIVGALLGIGR
jgi:hypothetical protein